MTVGRHRARAAHADVVIDEQALDQPLERVGRDQQVRRGQADGVDACARSVCARYVLTAGSRYSLSPRPRGGRRSARRARRGRNGSTRTPATRAPRCRAGPTRAPALQPADAFAGHIAAEPEPGGEVHLARQQLTPPASVPRREFTDDHPHRVGVETGPCWSRISGVGRSKWPFWLSLPVSGLLSVAGVRIRVAGAPNSWGIENPTDPANPSWQQVLDDSRRRLLRH